MSRLQESAASISFFGDDLDPDEVSAILGGKPTFGVQKGGVWLTESGVETTAKTGSWRLVSERRQPGDLDGQIADLLRPLSEDLAAWNNLSRRFGGRVFCGLFMASPNDGVTLMPDTLCLIAERGLKLDLDIYSADWSPC